MPSCYFAQYKQSHETLMEEGGRVAPFSALGHYCQTVGDINLKSKIGSAPPGSAPPSSAPPSAAPPSTAPLEQSWVRRHALVYI